MTMREEHEKFKWHTSLEDQIASLDLDAEAGRALLKTAEIRKGVDGPEVLFKGEWLELCRTDLTDDVATGKGKGFYRGKDGEIVEILSDSEMSIEQSRAHYMACIKYGVRIRDTHDNRCRLFACVDSWSDG